MALYQPVRHLLINMVQRFLPEQVVFHFLPKIVIYKRNGNLFCVKFNYDVEYDFIKFFWVRLFSSELTGSELAELLFRTSGKPA